MTNNKNIYSKLTSILLNLTVCIAVIVLILTLTPIFDLGGLYRSTGPCMYNGQGLKENDLNFSIGYDVFKQEIQRYDIVTFRPIDPRTNKQIRLSKRIIAMPGEHFVYQNDVVYINGEPLDEPYLYLDDGQHHTNYYEYVLAEDEYIILGDNRHDSYDSRLLGPIKRSQIGMKEIWSLDNDVIIKYFED